MAVFGFLWLFLEKLSFLVTAWTEKLFAKSLSHDLWDSYPHIPPFSFLKICFCEKKPSTDISIFNCSAQEAYILTSREVILFIVFKNICDWNVRFWSCMEVSYTWIWFMCIVLFGASWMHIMNIIHMWNHIQYPMIIIFEPLTNILQPYVKLL